MFFPVPAGSDIGIFQAPAPKSIGRQGVVQPHKTARWEYHAALTGRWNQLPSYYRVRVRRYPDGIHSRIAGSVFE